MTSALIRTGAQGIYYPDFFFIDEMLAAPAQSYEDAPTAETRKHVDQMK